MANANAQPAMLQPITNIVDYGDIILKLRDQSRLRVQSTVLLAASPVLSAMIHGNFIAFRQVRTTMNPLIITLEADEAGAMTSICQMLHYRSAPPSLSNPGQELVERLVAITEVAIKYGCGPAIALQVEAVLWRSLAMKTYKRLSAEEMKDLATVAYILDHATLFLIFTRRLVLHYTEPFAALKSSTEYLELSTNILVRLEEQRNSARLAVYDDVPNMYRDATHYVCTGCGKLANQTDLLANIAKQLNEVLGWRPQLRNKPLSSLLPKLREVGDVYALSHPDCERAVTPVVFGNVFREFVDGVIENTGLCLRCTKEGWRGECTHEVDWENLSAMWWL